MEVIVVILIVVFSLISASDKNRKKAKAAAEQQARAKGAPARQARTKAAKAEEKPLPPAQRGKVVRAASGGAFKGFGEALDRLAQQMEEQAALPRQVEAVTASPVSTEGRSLLEDEDCRGGSMPHVHNEGRSALADEDCFGGSMAHTHTEGVSRTDHARRMAAIDTQRGDSDVLPQTIDARALRRAVVMAEVLGKPRAMRRM